MKRKRFSPGRCVAGFGASLLAALGCAALLWMSGVRVPGSTAWEWASGLLPALLLISLAGGVIGGLWRGRRENRQMEHSLFSARSFLIFFGLLAFVVTCCLLVFISGYEIPGEVLEERAPRTFAALLLLSLVGSVVDGLRRKYTVERPVKRILEVTQRLRQGDFSARVEPMRGSPLARANELDVIIDNLNRMAEELSGVETLRTDFVANVSHELKTPLSVIQNYATLLQAVGLPEEERMECARSVSQASRRLADLISNILRLNRLENQQIFPEGERYNLSGQLCECLLSWQEEWEKKQLTLETEIADDVMICADAELLSLVWNNLLSNAIKFNRPGGKLIVKLEPKGEFVEVQVSDTGCGMSPDVGRHIFEKFYQGDPSHAAQGNGLGLALVRRVIDIVDGEISVQSASGAGSRFTVRLRRDGA